MSSRTNPFRKTRNQEGVVSKITTILGFEPSDAYKESQLMDVFNDFYLLFDSLNHELSLVIVCYHNSFIHSLIILMM